MSPADFELVDAGRAAYPELAVDPAAFVAYVRERCPEGTTNAADLYLAFACTTGQPAAIAAFTTACKSDVDQALKSLEPRARDDARQILHQRLFAGSSPKIAAYSGRGPLRRWVRVVAGRILLELVAKVEPIADDWEVAALPVAGDDPELAYLKARYRAEYKRAFRDALAALEDRERTVLAQYHVDRLTIDELGTLYGIHRVTASRWVKTAQDHLRQGVLDLLRERLGLSGAELRSVTRLVRSQLSVSLAEPITPNP